MHSFENWRIFWDIPQFQLGTIGSHGVKKSINYFTISKFFFNYVFKVKVVKMYTILVNTKLF